MDKKTIKTLMSSVETVYETPDGLFDKLDEIFHFDLDVCAVKENAKVDNFISPEQNSLEVDWSGTCWMNPPYGRGIKKWIDRAFDQSEYYNVSNVVCLLPSRTDTKWFQVLWDHAYALCFLPGRLKFSGMKDAAPFPSVIAVFGRMSGNQLGALEKIGNVRV